MAMEQQITDKIQKWLAEHTNGSPCPFCGSNEWMIGDVIVTAPMYEKGKNNVNLGRNTPMIQAVCKNCYYIHHFAALPILGESD